MIIFNSKKEYTIKDIIEIENKYKSMKEYTDIKSLERELIKKEDRILYLENQNNIYNGFRDIVGFFVIIVAIFNSYIKEYDVYTYIFMCIDVIVFLIFTITFMACKGKENKEIRECKAEKRVIENEIKKRENKECKNIQVDNSKIKTNKTEKKK